ncbi:Zinc finger protein CONSTANS-LIKE 7 [Cardamine amara subsp. amara]|uniref:Zinc finger protein CONSTANS-LIKE 7 n=1 Tax=Cardamine amara subsp. amara TaxID=228776 RepID=A0ABD1BD35_CARAN
MVVDVETRAASVAGGRMAARACDACIKRSRASWYCPADDAFLCQSCDTSIHSANHLAKRHERVRLQSSSSSPELIKMTNTEDKTTSVWYEGFRRKARTPRNKGLAFEKLLQIDSNDPLVPELGGEEEDGDENEESLSCCVPVFDPSSDMLIDDNSFRLCPDGVYTNTNRKELGEIEKAIMDDDGLIEFFPLDMDLGSLTMDVESLLEEKQPFLEVKEPNDIGLVKEENNIGFEISYTALKRVKHEEEKEAKCANGEESEDEDKKTSLFLRLDYEAVITAWGSDGSPWKTGIKPEFNLGDCWRECLLEGNTCPTHVVGMGGYEELVSAVGLGTRQQGRSGGGSDGEREARVLRYREKRRTRLFSKKIRYEVRKLNAEQRPRIKGRFVKRTSCDEVTSCDLGLEWQQDF